MKKAFMILLSVILILAVIVGAVIFYNSQIRSDVPAATTAASDSTEQKISKYQSYIEQNSDFVGYIKIEGTQIDYPVVQCGDNEYYLTHNFKKEDEARGAIYMNTECSASPLDFNTVLYGHNWLDKTMFSQLVKYSDIDFYREHPVINFDTAYDDMQWKIYAVFITNADESEDNGYIFNYVYPHLDGENFNGYINEVNKRTLYKTDVDINSNDKILTLSTCSREMDTNNYRADARIVIVARLVRDGESTEVDTSAAALNPNPKYPQKYCDILKIQNNYTNDEYWYPVENE